MSSGIQNNRSRAAVNVRVMGSVIFFCITLVSCVSSFKIYSEGFADLAENLRKLLSLFCVAAVEGTLLWLLMGYSKAFTEKYQRMIAVVGICFFVWVMYMNIMTHFMMVKKMTLSEFQNGWLSWGAISVLIAAALFWLGTFFRDPSSQAERQALIIEGNQQMAILSAKDEALYSERVQRALLNRGEQEAEDMAGIIEGQEVYRPTTRITQRPATAHYRTGKESRR